MNRLALALCALVASCATPEPPAPAGAASPSSSPSSAPVAEAAPDPGWWADGRVCYEVFVRVLRPGSWGVTRLAGGDPAGEAGAGVGGAADPLHVDEGGRIRSWVPLPTLAPLEVYVLELSRDP